MAHLRRDGVALGYEEAGSGSPPLLFIHALAGERGHFAQQLRHFRRRHRVVAIDLRGHGESDAPHQEYTLTGFVDDVAWTCRELGLHRPVIVGHSLGGLVSLGVAASHTELPSAVVALDAPLLVPAPALEPLRPLMAAIDGPEWQRALLGFFASNFLACDAPETKARVLDTAARLPRHVAVSAVKAIAPDVEPVLQRLRIPVLYIAATVPSDLDRLRTLQPDILIGRIVGSGHWFPLEVPDQLNAMLDRFLTIVERTPAALGATPDGAADAGDVELEIDRPSVGTSPVRPP